VSRLVPLKRTEPLVAWRITRAEFAASALFGQGALPAEGRWHRVGQPVVYLAKTWSLAALAVFVHLGRRDFAIPLIYLGITILPEVSALALDIEALPERVNLFWTVSSEITHFWFIREVKRWGADADRSRTGIVRGLRLDNALMVIRMPSAPEASRSFPRRLGTPP